MIFAEVLLLALVIVGGTWFVVTSFRRDVASAELAAARHAVPGAADGSYLLLARDHHRRLTHWARIFEDLRRNDFVWPVLPAELRTEIDRELARFYEQ